MRLSRPVASTGEPDGPGWWLSTVELDEMFRGIDDRGFETCVFWGPATDGIRSSEVLDRYHTEDAAIAGHAAHAAKLESGWRP